jgi:site-specific DNA recombinase
MRAAIYARVSSQAQREKHTIDSQLHMLTPFVAAQGWTLAGTYIDDGRSAKTGQLEHRDGFGRLVRDAMAKKFDVLVVADINRLTRTEDMRERAEILGPFQAAGIRIVTPSGGELDLRTMLGELYVTLHAIVAAEENRKRAEAIMRGKARAIAEGRKPAGPTPFGHAYDRASGTWSIDEAAAAIVREIFERVAAGESCVMVADDLVARDATPAPRTGWSRAAVYRIVRKRSVVGEWDADKARAAIVHIPPIISEAQWQAAARALLAHKRRGLVRTKHFYLLEGIARCGHCGSPIAIRSASLRPTREGRPIAAAYVCRSRKLNQGCSAKIVKCHELDERVWSALCDELDQPDLLAALADIDRVVDAERDWQTDAAGHRAHLARLERVAGAVMARFRRGLVTDESLDRELAAITRERKMVREQLATAERAIGSAQSTQDRMRLATDTLTELRAALPLATPELRRELLRELACEQGVVLVDGRARLDLWLLRRSAPASESPIVSVVGPDYRTQHEKISGVRLRVRRVA